MRARGKYKSARETFAETSMTPENREMTSAIVGDLHEQLVDRDRRRERKLDFRAEDVRSETRSRPLSCRRGEALVGFVGHRRSTRMRWKRRLEGAKVGKVRAR